MPTVEPGIRGHPLPARHPEVTLGPVCLDGWRRKNLVGLPGGDRVLTMGDLEFGVLRMLDGQVTPEEVCAQASSESRPLTPDRLGRLLGVFAQRGLLDLPAAPDPAAQSPAVPPPAAAPSRGAPGLMRLLRAEWKLTDVEEWLRPGLPVARVILSRWAALGFVPLVLLALVPAALDPGPVLTEARTAFTSWSSGIAVVLALLLSLAIHEWGHAIACLHWGGRVRAFGLRWRIPFLSVYCDAPGYRLLPRLGHRLGTCFAGVWTSLLLLVPVAAAWYLTELPAPWHAALAAILVGLVASCVVNLVPLFSSDGYQLLSQALGVRNLTHHSTQILLAILSRSGRAEVRAALVPRWLKVLYVAYGFFSLLVILGVCVLMLSLVTWLTAEQFGTGLAWGVGILLALVMLGGLGTAGRRHWGGTDPAVPTRAS